MWSRIKKEVADRLTKHLHLDVRFYGRAFSWMSLSHSSAILRGLATTFIMARILPSELFGQFRYVIAIFGVATVATLAGLSNSIIQGVAKGDTSVAHIALKKNLKFSPIGCLILIAFALERMLRGEFLVAWSLVGAAITFPLYSISSMYSDILLGKENMKQLAKINFAINAIFTVIFLPILFFYRNLLILSVAYLGVDAIMRAYLSFHAVRKLPNTGDATPYLRVGNHLSAINIIQVIAGKIDQVLIQFFGGYQSLASYSIAILIPEQIKSFVKSSSGIFLQRLSRHEANEKNLKNIQRHFWIATGGTGVLIATYILVIPFLLPILFPQYSDAVLPTIVYSIGLLSLPSFIGINYFSIHHDIKRLWRFHILGSVIQILTTIALVPFFGGWGGIWAKTITRLSTLSFGYPRLPLKKSETEQPATLNAE